MKKEEFIEDIKAGKFLALWWVGFCLTFGVLSAIGIVALLAKAAGLIKVLV